MWKRHNLKEMNKSSSVELLPTSVCTLSACQKAYVRHKREEASKINKKLKSYLQSAKVGASVMLVPWKRKMFMHAQVQSLLAVVLFSVFRQLLFYLEQLSDSHLYKHYWALLSHQNYQVSEWFLDWIRGCHIQVPQTSRKYFLHEGPVDCSICVEVT